ncbi:MAG: cytochrome c3 family protein [Pseudomonadota bacterium]
MKHYSHIIRFAVLLMLVGVGFFAVRSLIVPDSFGIYGGYTYGYHRGDSDAEQAALPVVYQGSDKCLKCHEKQVGIWEKGRHKGVPCENCHGSWQAHNDNTTTTKNKMERDKSIEACLLCHGKLDARPQGFAQVAGIKEHLADKGQEFEQGMLCADCHDAHDPKP